MLKEKNHEIVEQSPSHFLSIIFLCGYAFFSFSKISEKIENAFLILLLFSAIHGIKNINFKKNKIILITALSWFCYIWLRSSLYQLTITNEFLPSEETIDVAKNWALLSIFPIISIALVKNNNSKLYFILFSLLGFIFSFIVSLNKIDYSTILDINHRQGFNFFINHFALYIGTILIGLLIFGLRHITYFNRKYLINFIFVVSFTVCFFLLMKTQTRMAMISLVIVFPTVTFLMHVKYSSGFRNENIMKNSLLFFLPCILIIFIFFPTLEKRFTAPDNSVIKYGISVGYSVDSRIELFKFGARKWLNQPILGIGPISSKELISESGDSYISERYHLHNTYLEVGMAWGIVGLSLCGFLITALLLGLYQNLSIANVPDAYTLFTLSSLFYWLLWSITEFNINRDAGLNHWILLAGLGYGILLSGSNKKSDE